MEVKAVAAFESQALPFELTSDEHDLRERARRPITARELEKRGVEAILT